MISISKKTVLKIGNKDFTGLYKNTLLKIDSCISSLGLLSVFSN
jgi:hypothetical protein